MKRFVLLLVLLPTLLGAQAAVLEVDFIDVGQADCILVRQGGQTLLIDAGNNADQALVEGYLRDQGVTRLDFVIATHAHEDHIGSMDAVIRDFDIGQVWFPRQTTTTATFRAFVAAVKDKGLTFSLPAPGTTFRLGSAVATFLGPPPEDQEDLNEGSAVVRLDFGTTSFLFTGDAGKAAEAVMLKGSVPLGATVLKVGHHGSPGSTTAAWVKNVTPRYAVISVGAGNTYGHPAKAVVDRLEKAGAVVYRTDESGTVVAVCDGTTVTFTPTVPSPSP